MKSIKSFMKKNKHYIAPSILSANFASLGEEVQSVLDSGADLIHFDVMDNHYVPNLSFGPLVCTALKKAGIKAPIDVHLMCKPVDNLIEAFIEAGADIISFHPEATEHIDRSINIIKTAGLKAGLAFNPATPLHYLDHIIDKLDLILIMSVNPGFGGQSFISSALNKIKDARKLINNSNNNILLEVDGGVNLKTLKEIAEAGADTFVMGSAIFNSPDYKKTIEDARKILNSL
tara:strand:+ start:1304 stop:1999 length:696 start_codon:yes stop_codon:yes gene_type:complete